MLQPVGRSGFIVIDKGALGLGDGGVAGQTDIFGGDAGITHGKKRTALELFDHRVRRSSFVIVCHGN